MRAAHPIAGEHDVPDLSEYRRPARIRRAAKKAAGGSLWLLVLFGFVLFGAKRAHQDVHQHPPAASKAR